MATPIDVSAIVNMIVPLIFLIMVVSILMSLVREFKGGF